MGIAKRIANLFQAKSNAALNKLEDPRQTLDLSYEQQLENLTKVKRAVAAVAEQEEKLQATATKLGTEVEAFRTKKETIKATYTAAEASVHIAESVSGISTSMADSGAAMQRAQDKVAEMQARSGALDELLASGALTDLTSSPTDDIQAQLDAAGGSNIDAQLAALRAQVAVGDALTSGTTNEEEK